MKIKDELSVDVRVTGMKEGSGKYAGMCGALLVDHRGKMVRVSGMDDEQREEFWNHPRRIIGRMVEVEYQNETAHGSLRHPRFKCLRPDKE
jgi:DNA ligase-1